MAVLVILFAQQIPGAAGARIIPSADRIAVGDWSYDAMGNLAAKGLIPGYAAREFHGDTLFDRLEMAAILGSVIKYTQGKKLDSSQTALIDKLVKEFRPELRSLDPAALEKWDGLAAATVTKKVLITGQLSAVAAEHSKSDSNISISALDNFSERSFGMVTLDADRTRFFRTDISEANPDKYFIRGFDSNFVWSIGKEYLNWGPSYIGSTILSDNIGGFLQVRASKEVDFGRLLGRFKITEFASKLDGSGDYFFGRRWEHPLSDRLHFGFTETATTDKAPNPLILAMPFYLYKHLFINNDLDFDNHVATDLTYRWKSGTEMYSQWLVEDMTEPKFLSLGNWFRVPRKTGLTLGFYTPHLLAGSPRSTFRAEYTYVDKQVYTSAESPTTLSYLDNSQIIGSPLGPNTNALYLRTEQNISGKLSVIGEYLNQKQRKDIDPPGIERSVLSFQLSYDLTPNKSISFRVAPFSITPSGMQPESSTEYEIRATYAF